jgi:hypothetical protein
MEPLDPEAGTSLLRKWVCRKADDLDKRTVSCGNGYAERLMISTSEQALLVSVAESLKVTMSRRGMSRKWASPLSSLWAASSLGWQF